MRVEPPERMVQLLQNLADEFADFAQGMLRGNPLLRMNVRKHPALILRPSAHLQSSRRIRGGLNHHSVALARFFSKLLEDRRRAQSSVVCPGIWALAIAAICLSRITICRVAVART